MVIAFATHRLERTFNSAKELVRTYGPTIARAIQVRMTVLCQAACLADIPTVPPFRRHELKGDRKGCFAIDLVHPHRLIFTPHHDPVPRKPDGGVDLERVTAIRILSVEDYH